jgi:hypothetical protein
MPPKWWHFEYKENLYFRGVNTPALLAPSSSSKKTS